MWGIRTLPLTSVSHSVGEHRGPFESVGYAKRLSAAATVNESKTG